MFICFHGLNSAGNNTASSKIKEYFKDEAVLSPTYTVYNWEQGVQDIEHFLEKVDTNEELIFVGGSTGALYAEYFANKYDGRVILLNPVTDKDQLKQFLGMNRNFITKEKYEFTVNDIDSFPGPVMYNTPRLVLVEHGDTILDQNITVQKYKNNSKVVEFSGGQHVFSHWKDALSEIEKFNNTVII